MPSGGGSKSPAYPAASLLASSSPRSRTARGIFPPRQPLDPMGPAEWAQSSRFVILGRADPSHRAHSPVPTFPVNGMRRSSLPCPMTAPERLATLIEKLEATIDILRSAKRDPGWWVTSSPHVAYPCQLGFRGSVRGETWGLSEGFMGFVGG
jgi:hypothetical protein